MDPRLRREVLELHAGICSALDDPNRLLILYLLSEGPRNVTDICGQLELPQSTVSRHLRVLRERGLVETRREGTSVIYDLADSRLLEAVDLLRAVLRGVYSRRAASVE
jgi:ArsR family transcriptional regulator